MRGASLAKFLRNLASAVEGLNDNELGLFLSNLERKDFASREASPLRDDVKRRHAKVDPLALEKALRELAELSTRSEGAELLDRMELSRKELEWMAKRRNVHVIKDDTVSKIKEKLVEMVIGSRLSSRAIRGQQY